MRDERGFTLGEVLVATLVLSIGLVALFAGFLVFIGYPALAAVLAAL